MTGIILITTFFASLSSVKTDTTLFPIEKEMNRLQLYMDAPPESFAEDTCYHYAELLILEIDKAGKMAGFNFTDHAPDWLIKSLQKARVHNGAYFRKIEALVIKSGLKNCKLIFPLVMESDDFPCGTAAKKRMIENNYFTFKGKNLKGSLVFMNQIRFVWPTRYIH